MRGMTYEEPQGKEPRQHLRDFRGHLHADGFNGHDALYADGRIQDGLALDPGTAQVLRLP